MLAVDHQQGANSFASFDYDRVGNRTHRTQSGMGFQPMSDVYGYDGTQNRILHGLWVSGAPHSVTDEGQGTHGHVIPFAAAATG